MKGVISHPETSPLQTPDWFAIGLLQPGAAATALRAILARVEGVEEWTFAVRGWAFRIIKERSLFKFDIDLEMGRPFESMNRWIEQMHPKHHRYYKESLAAAENLPDIPFADFAAMPRCNIKQLEKVSSSVRILPEVLKAAKSMPEKAFVEKMNREHSQHLAVKQPVVMAEPDACEDFEEAIEMAIVCEHCVSRAEAIRAISISYKQDWAVEYERRKAEGAA